MATFLLESWLGQKFPKPWRKIYSRPRAKTITALSSSKQVMDSLHGPNTMKQSRSIALSRLGYDIQVKSLDPFLAFTCLKLPTIQFGKVCDFEKHLVFCVFFDSSLKKILLSLYTLPNHPSNNVQSLMV